MTYRLGSGAWIGIGEESTYGTAVAPSVFYQPRPGDEDLSLVYDVIEVDQLTSGRGILLESQQKGKRRVEGTLTQVLRYESTMFPFLLSHLLQEDAADAGSDPYYHDWTFAYTSAMAAKGLTIASYRDGDIGSKAADYPRQFKGCRPTALELSFEDNSVVTAAWTIPGQDADWCDGSSITPAYATDQYMMLPSQLASPVAFCRIDFNRSDPDTGLSSSNDIKCRSGSIRIEQEFEDTGSLQDAVYAGLRYNGRLMITGSLELEFQGTGTTGDDISKAYINQELAHIRLGLQGAAVDSKARSLTIDLHSCMATSAAEPHASEVGTIYQSLEFRATRVVGEASGTEGGISLTNSTATV